MRVASISARWVIVSRPDVVVCVISTPAPSDTGALDTRTAAAAIVMTCRIWPLTAVYNTRHADRLRSPRTDLSALREPELSRVVRLLCRQRVRSAPRPRIQRDPKRRGADRRPAPPQIH